MLRTATSAPGRHRFRPAWPIILAAALLASKGQTVHAEDSPVRSYPAVGGLVSVFGETEHASRLAVKDPASYDLGYQDSVHVQLWSPLRIVRNGPTIAPDSKLPTIVLRCRDDRESGAAKVSCSNAELPITLPHTMQMCHSPQRIAATAAQRRAFEQVIRSGKSSKAGALPDSPWVVLVERRGYTTQIHKVGRVRPRSVRDRVLEHQTSFLASVPATSASQHRFPLLRPLNLAGAMPAQVAAILTPKGGQNPSQDLHHLYYRGRALDALDTSNLSADLRVALSYNQATAAIAIGNLESAQNAIAALHRDMPRVSPALSKLVTPLLGPLDEVRKGELLLHNPCSSVFQL